MAHLGGPPYKCPEEGCDRNDAEKCFRDRTALERHIRGFHMGLRPHICEDCQMGFQQAYHLDKHRRNIHKNNNSGNQGARGSNRKRSGKPKWSHKKTHGRIYAIPEEQHEGNEDGMEQVEERLEEGGEFNQVPLDEGGEIDENRDEPDALEIIIIYEGPPANPRGNAAPDCVIIYDGPSTNQRGNAAPVAADLENPQGFIGGMEVEENENEGVGVVEEQPDESMDEENDEEEGEVNDWGEEDDWNEQVPRECLPMEELN